MRKNHIYAFLMETVASQLEGDIARLKDVSETLALSEGAVVERKEVRRLAGAAIVVPDGHTVAGQCVLGVHAGPEGVVVNAPVTVDSGLVASDGSGAHFSRELGLAVCRVANVARLPGLESDTSHREAGIGGHGEGCRGGKGLCCVSKLYTSKCKRSMDGITLEKCILAKDCCLVNHLIIRVG